MFDCVPPALGWAVGCGADPTAGGAFDVPEFVWFEVVAGGVELGTGEGVASEAGGGGGAGGGGAGG